jgi:hypothetical protein
LVTFGLVATGELYLRPFLLLGLTEYFVFYNNEQPQQLLNNETPTRVYDTTTGSGKKIVNSFSARKTKSVDEDLGQRHWAVKITESILN